MAAPSPAVTTILDELRPVAACREPGELGEAVQAVARRLEADFYAYHVLRAPGSGQAMPRYVTDYPTAWQDEYLARDFKTADPVLRQAAAGTAPFQWRELTPATRLGADIMAGARAHGLADGLAVPLSGNGEFAVMTLACDRSPADMQAWLAERTAPACMAALSIHDAGRRVFFGGEASAASRLTPRERDCIQWTAAGKTSWEIGEILGIAEKTANIHLANAMAKLDVCSRPQLVARACWLGILTAL